MQLLNKYLPPKYKIKFIQDARGGYYIIQQRFMFFLYFAQRDLTSFGGSWSTVYKYRDERPTDLLNKLLKDG
jgi:hypothetical protein